MAVEGPAVWDNGWGVSSLPAPQALVARPRAGPPGRSRPTDAAPPRSRRADGPGRRLVGAGGRGGRAAADARSGRVGPVRVRRSDVPGSCECPAVGGADRCRKHGIARTGGASHQWYHVVSRPHFSGYGPGKAAPSLLEAGNPGIIEDGLFLCGRKGVFEHA